MYPSVIDPSAFRGRGISRTHLMPFEGLKEDISFADVDFSSTSAYDFGGEGAVRVLFRPPAEESHYYRSESRDLALTLLRYLAAEGARVVFSPRLARHSRPGRPTHEGDTCRPRPLQICRLRARRLEERPPASTST